MICALKCNERKDELSITITMLQILQMVNEELACRTYPRGDAFKDNAVL